ncbi:MAG: hypothetical protein K9W44_08095 [Candidatus Lokiarchaeota archaeon]|nr:hypothetical protein [Candidatus Harpocratesius repetitus]
MIVKQIDLPEFNIIIPPEVLEFLKQREIVQIYIDVRLEEEPCIQIYTPTVRLESMSSKSGEKSKSSQYPVKQEKNGINFNFSQDFVQRFSLNSTVELRLKGFFRKRVDIGNIDPILINVCKV